MPIHGRFKFLTGMRARSFSICVCPGNGFAAPERERKRTKGNLVRNMVLADIKVGKQLSLSPLAHTPPAPPISFTCCTLERNLFPSVQKRPRKY
jgi:hypothetical protein